MRLSVDALPKEWILGSTCVVLVVLSSGRGYCLRVLRLLERPTSWWTTSSFKLATRHGVPLAAEDFCCVDEMQMEMCVDLDGHFGLLLHILAAG